jgi:hypothetical protein
MLNPDHPDTKFIFEAAAYLDRLTQLLNDLDSLPGIGLVNLDEMVATRIEALRKHANEHFMAKVASIDPVLSEIRQRFAIILLNREKEKAAIFQLISKLEFEFGTWAI